MVEETGQAEMVETQIVINEDIVEDEENQVEKEEGKGAGRWR